MISQHIIKRLLAALPRNKTIESDIKGLYFYCADKPSEVISYIQQPSICIVLQGERDIYLGSECQCFDNSHLMFCPVNIPLSMHIRHATTDNPVIVMSMKLKVATISQVLAKIPAKYPLKRSTTGIKWHLDDRLLAVFERLINLLNYPEDIEFLSELVRQEIYYRLLTAEQGDMLRQLVNVGSHSRQIAQATQWIREHLSETLIIDNLARDCGMSVSGFYQKFKEITQLSPLQYQKNLRLMQARKLNQAGALQISQIASQVGYESASQFSREYKRQFGITPKQDRESFERLL